MIYRILAVVAVLVLVGGTFLLGRPEAERDQPVATGSTPIDAGYSSRDAAIVETGPDGQPLYRLVAERITQPPEGGTVTLENLTMNYRTAQGTEWHLRADHGTLPEDARQVDLDGAVLVNGPLEPGGPAVHAAAGTTAGTKRASVAPRELVMATEHLEVDTEEETAVTDAPVTLTWSGQRLLSRGIAANLKDQTVRLESSVHGHFLPP